MGPFLLCHIRDPYSPRSHYAVLCRINVVGWMVGGGLGLHLWRHTVTTAGTRGEKSTITEACCGAGRNWKRRDVSELFPLSGPVWEHRCRWWAGVRKRGVRHGQLENLLWLLGWLSHVCSRAAGASERRTGLWPNLLSHVCSCAAGVSQWRTGPWPKWLSHVCALTPSF